MLEESKDHEQYLKTQAGTNNINKASETLIIIEQMEETPWGNVCATSSNVRHIKEPLETRKSMAMAKHAKKANTALRRA